jgi:predicted hydrocarbon binding protein
VVPVTFSSVEAERRKPVLFRAGKNSGKYFKKKISGKSLEFFRKFSVRKKLKTFYSETRKNIGNA